MEKRDHYLLMKRSQVDLVTRGILNWIEKQYSQLSYRALLCIDRLYIGHWGLGFKAATDLKFLISQKMEN